MFGLIIRASRYLNRWLGSKGKGGSLGSLFIGFGFGEGLGPFIKTNGLAYTRHFYQEVRETNGPVCARHFFIKTNGPVRVAQHREQG